MRKKFKQRLETLTGFHTLDVPHHAFPIETSNILTLSENEIKKVFDSSDTEDEPDPH